MPLFDACTVLCSGNGGKDFCESVDTMLRQLDCHVDGVYDPSQDQIESGKRVISLSQFLHGDRSCRVGLSLGRSG